MLNTLFLGYLSPKWERLARFLSVVLLPILFYIFDEFKFLGFQDDFFMDFIIGYIVFVLIISYTLKPFVVKEN